VFTILYFIFIFHEKKVHNIFYFNIYIITTQYVNAKIAIIIRCAKKKSRFHAEFLNCIEQK